MPSRFTKTWGTVRREKPLDEQRVATYARLMEAQERIAQARSRRGEAQARIADALAASEAGIEEGGGEDDLYLAALARYVEALGGRLEGGRLEVQAVFRDETIVVRREPDDGGGPAAA
jgi:hypothetical protein